MRNKSSRRFTKIFELWQRTVADIDEGTFTEIKISQSWCEIRTANANSKFRSTSEGITNATNQIIITTRKRNDLTYNLINQFIKYRGEEYVINNEPYEVEFDNMYIEIVATKLEEDSVPILTPIT